MPARVLLVDDHELVRAGIRALLVANGFEVVAEGNDGDQVMDLLHQHPVDVLLLDLTMRRCSGLEALTQVRSHWPQLPVILLSMHDTRDYMLRAMRAGANGYLLKDAAVEELRDALDTVLAGQRYLSRRVAGQVIEALNAPNPPDELSSRQREVLYWLAKGKSNKEVAQLLDLSVKTVETHRAQIMDRLAIRDLPGLVMYALRRGIIRLDD